MAMGEQHWTAVVVSGETTTIRDHFGSFSAPAAAEEVRARSPAGSRVVALVPGKHAVNSHAFSIGVGCAGYCPVERPRTDVRFIDPCDFTVGGR